MRPMIFFSRRLWIAAVLGGALAVVFGILGYGAWQDYLAFPDEPASVPIKKAVADVGDRHPWVQLVDARWLCDMPIRPLRKSSSFVALTDPRQQVLIVAELRGMVTCSQVQRQKPAGTLATMREPMLNKMKDSGLRVPSSTTPVFHLCTYCGAGNSMTGVIVCSILAVVSLSLFPLVLWLRRRVAKETGSAPSQPGPP